MAIELIPLAEGWGAEVRRLDPRKAIAGDDAAALRQAFIAHSLLLFRGYALTPVQHIKLSRVFGELDNHATLPHLQHADHAEIILITNADENGRISSQRNVGQQWHSDLSCTTRPPTASVLQAQILPRVGGDTMFANMHLAFEALSEPMQHFLMPLKAVHDVAHARHQRHRDPETLAQVKRLNPPVVQPVVRRHPESDRPALYVNEMLTTAILGLTSEESDMLLSFLLRHSTRPEFTYRHRWQPHDILIWDNRSLIHCALANYEGLRRMHRTTIIGTASGELLETAVH